METEIKPKKFACRIGTGKKVHLCLSLAGPRCHVDSRHTRRGKLVKVTGKVSASQLCQHCWSDLASVRLVGFGVGLEVTD